METVFMILAIVASIVLIFSTFVIKKMEKQINRNNQAMRVVAHTALLLDRDNVKIDYTQQDIRFIIEDDTLFVAEHIKESNELKIIASVEVNVQKEDKETNKR